jgi:hypothetical protein
MERRRGWRGEEDCEERRMERRMVRMERRGGEQGSARYPHTTERRSIHTHTPHTHTPHTHHAHTHSPHTHTPHSAHLAESP